MAAAATKTQPDSLKERYLHVCDRIDRAASAAGRAADEIILVAVTKHAEPDQCRELLDLGHRDFGENRVQQLIQRAAMVEEYLQRLRVAPSTRRPGADPGETLFGAPSAAAAQRALPGANTVRWHMIGHLQRNKVRKALDFTRLIHSVDSLRLAEEIQQFAVKRDQSIEVLVQVNCSGERSKFGCPVPATLPLAEQIATMVNVRVRGLMTMAAPGDSAEDARPAFGRCRELFEEIARTPVNDGRFNILSMGMSEDFEAAIAEGANIIRVGSAIFGPPANPIPDDDDEG